MFGSEFSHYLTYGATDQRTIIELSDVIDGLLVPSTVASFQRDGTRGFVLTLSASVDSPDYAIDPRFPLFQQPLVNPKKSHESLAALLGDADLVCDYQPMPHDFDNERLESIADRWIKFNLGYTKVDSKFQKYAQRLNESVVPEDSKGPRYVMAPYFMARGVKDPWWERSRYFFEITRQKLESQGECVRVVALSESNQMPEAINQIDCSNIAVWIDDLNEIAASSDRLASYLRGIRHAERNDVNAFALYGGFFSVLASNVGLKGNCHGIGFGEHRRWIELPRSGPAPARYYVPILHRYVSREDAFALWRADEELFECKCVECQGKNPIQLGYHELMKHSVYCRDMEIRKWQIDVGDISERLSEEYEQFAEALDFATMSERRRDNLFRLGSHIPRWINAFSDIVRV